MEKYKDRKGNIPPRNYASERAKTCSPSNRLKAPSSLKPSELNLIKAQNHIIKGKLIDSPSAVEQICNILHSIDSNSFQFGPKSFQVNTFSSMQKRESEKLLIWLKSKLSQLKQTPELTMQDYIQYKQSIVNIGLASVMNMVGTICKQLGQTLGCLWSQTFSMLERIINSSVKKQSEKDKVIVSQEIKLQKQQALFIERITNLQQQQALNLKQLKSNFKDCIITNRQLNKQIYRLNDDLKGQYIKLQNIEQALIRSLDLNLNYSQGDNIKWSRMILNSLFRSRKLKQSPKFIKPNRMLKYEQYSKFKVQNTIAKYLKTTKQYELYSIDEIISKFLQIPSLDLKDINMPGLFLIPPKQNEINKINYDFILEDVYKKPLRTVFKACQSVSKQIQTDIQLFEDKHIQTFPMTNLITQVIQTQRIISINSSSQTQNILQLEIPSNQNKQKIFVTQKEEEEKAKLKLITQQRKSSFFPRNNVLKNQIETSNTTFNMKQNKSPGHSENSIHGSFVSLSRKNSIYKQLNEFDTYQNLLKNQQLVQKKSKQPPINSLTSPISSTSKLKQAITKIVRVSNIIKPQRKSAIIPVLNRSIGNQLDKPTPNMSYDSLLSNDIQPFQKPIIRKQSYRKQSYRNQKSKQDLFSIQFVDTEALLQMQQVSSNQSILAQQSININTRFESLIKKNQKISLFMLKQDPFGIQLKDHVFDYEIQNNNRIWQVANKASKSQVFNVKNVAHKVLYLTRLFATIFSQTMKNKIFSNKMISDSINKKYCSSNLHPKYVFKPLQSLPQILINKLFNESKKKQETEKSLKLLIGELLVLSQTKQMQIFVNLMGLSSQLTGATQLQILVRMMYFFNPTKPHAFSPDLVIPINTLKTHLFIITDNILDKSTINTIIKQLSQNTTIILSQVFKQVCKQINSIKQLTYHKYKYISKYFNYPTLNDLNLLFGITTKFDVIHQKIKSKFTKLSDCFNKQHQRCLSQEKIWRLGLSCNLPNQQQYLNQLYNVKIPKNHLNSMSSYSQQDKIKQNKNYHSFLKLTNIIDKSIVEEQKVNANSLLYIGLLKYASEQIIGKDLVIISDLLSLM